MSDEGSELEDETLLKILINSITSYMSIFFFKLEIYDKFASILEIYRLIKIARIYLKKT